MVLGKPRATKDCHAWADEVEIAKSANEFAKHMGREEKLAASGVRPLQENIVLRDGIYRCRIQKPMNLLLCCFCRRHGCVCTNQFIQRPTIQGFLLDQFATYTLELFSLCQDNRLAQIV